jgi:Flp pilus assembly protein TadB
MTDRDPQEPSRPRSEPEIIPPDHSRRNDRSRIFVSINENGDTRRVYLAKPGPFTILLALAVLALIALVMLILLLSVAVIWIPVVIVLVAAFIASVYWRRFRSWLARR